MIDLYLIAAVAENGIIGSRGELPWKGRPYARADMDHFVSLTTGYPIIMGRNTYESLKKPLPRRHNIVLSSSNSAPRNGVSFVRTLDEAIEEAERNAMGKDKAWVIGGQKVYEQTIDRAVGLEITEIHEAFEGDTRFPSIDSSWVEQSRRDGGPISFVSYRRARKP